MFGWWREILFLDACLFQEFNIQFFHDEHVGENNKNECYRGPLLCHPEAQRETSEFDLVQLIDRKNAQDTPK
jgi:hypothetical protein